MFTNIITCIFLINRHTSKTNIHLLHLRTSKYSTFPKNVMRVFITHFMLKNQTLLNEHNKQEKITKS